MDERKDFDALAGEYVLGSLSERERAAVARRLATGDARLAALIADWERRLTPMSARVPATMPPSNVLEGVLGQIATAAASNPDWSDIIVLLRSQVRRWQRATMALAACIAAIGIAFAVLSLSSGLGDRRDFVALLVALDSNPAADEARASVPPTFVARFGEKRDTITVRQIGGRRPDAGRTYIAWLRSPESRSGARLGPLLASEAETTLRLPDGLNSELARAEIAISLEATSSTSLERPRGPLLAIGRFRTP